MVLACGDLAGGHWHAQRLAASQEVWGHHEAVGVQEGAGIAPSSERQQQSAAETALEDHGQIPSVQGPAMATSATTRVTLHQESR